MEKKVAGKLHIPVFGLKGRAPVNILGDAAYALGTDAAELAVGLARGGADALMLDDLSTDPQEYADTVAVLGEVCKACPAPVYIGGSAKRMSVVADYMGAGAAAVFFDARHDNEIACVKETAETYGGGKTYVYLADVSFLARIPGYLELGATQFVLKCFHPSAEDLAAISAAPHPLIVMGKDPTVLEQGNVAGFAGEAKL
ncbi:MAG: hypothetical protein LBR77_02870 [Lachnospiraceae bacterium]|jgi:hypothetical protein|nr:hypothetical protein [Lachnospiraceae bacterium]